MDPDEKTNYLPNYRRQHFQELSGNLHRIADIRRKCLTQCNRASFTINSNLTTCHLLKESLKSYSRLIDDQQGINNYAPFIQHLAARNKLECTKWQSQLQSHVKDMNNLIKPLPCGNITCSESKITDDDIAQLFEFVPDEKSISLNAQRRSNASVSEFTKNVKIIPNKQPFQKNMKSADNNLQWNQNNHNEENIKRPIYQKKYPQIPQDNIKKSNFQKNIQPCRRDMQDDNKNNYSKDNRQNCKGNEKNSFATFKTAREELQDQNIKKYGTRQPNNQQQSSLSHGGHKKSLGLRRGVQSKFIPPIKRDDDGGTMNKNENAGWDPDEIVDERLKNVEPRMVELIRSEIMDCGPPITWDDIAGLEFAKTAIQEAVVWPLLRPDIFTGLRRPPKGILLFGPPGTGKTLIGKCIASQSQSTFFSISASSLTSKWVGDGEKMVKTMFAVARCHQPAVIFIDEVDSLLSQRSETEHESSRRIKTEFLVQLDGASTAEEDRILVVGATNRPQELDEAARRRFVKRLYIPLPEKQARLEIVRRLMETEKNNLSESNMDEVANLSDGYSGADMKNLCSEASLGPIRSIDMSKIQHIQPGQVRAITMEDFKSALNRVRASVSTSDLDQYIVWDRTYGSGGW